MAEVASVAPPARGGIARAAGLLLIGRQTGAAVFTLAFFAVPALAGRAAVDQLVWAWFAVLFLSSVLDLGLERAMAFVAGPGARSGQSSSEGGGSGSLMRLRLASIPLTAVAVFALFTIAHVGMPWAASVATIVWTVAVQVQGVGFACLRAEGNATFEPAVALAGRVVQSAVLLAVVAIGASVTVVLLAVAAVDVAVATAVWVAWRRLGDHRRTGDWRARLGWSDLAMFTAIEVFAFAYLRADTVVVGHILGRGPGATYSLAYRVMDGMTGLATPFLLVVLPAAARMVADGETLTPWRQKAGRLLPIVGGSLALAAILATVPLAAFVPRMHDATAALRLLLATVPLYFFSAFELHLLSAEGDNRPIVQLGAALLVANVALTIVLVPRLGLAGAAVALVVTELMQVAWVVQKNHARAAAAGVGAGVGAVTKGEGALALTFAWLVLVGWLLDTGRPAVACLCAVVFAAAIARSVMRRPMVTEAAA